MSESKDQLRLSEEFKEKKLSEKEAASFFVAREIKQAIIEYDVNELTLKKVIELLALELEDRDLMLAVVDAVKGRVRSAGEKPPIVT